MDYLSNFIDDTTDWWGCSTHASSKKSNKNNLILMYSNLFSQYRIYERFISLHMDKPIVPSFINDDQKKILLDYYNNPPVKLKDKLQERRNNTLQVCPYCGCFTHPNTLDHFIPKDDFSHYSIFQNNLVPQCRRCASIKADKYFDPLKGCIFIHPFYSDLLSRVKFKFHLSFDKKFNSIIVNNVTFSFNKPTVVEKSRLKNHLEALKVKSRIKEYCLNEFKELRRKSKKYHFDLDLWISGKISIVDVNGSDWCTAFYESLQDCDDAKFFLNSLMPTISQNLPLVLKDEMEQFEFE